MDLFVRQSFLFEIYVAIFTPILYVHQYVCERKVGGGATINIEGYYVDSRSFWHRRFNIIM